MRTWTHKTMPAPSFWAILFAFVFAAFTCSTAFAVSVTPLGILTPGGTVSGTVIGNDDAFAASLGDYWIFSGSAGDSVDIDINRTEAAPDLIATLFFGDVTGVDVDTISPNGLIDGLLTPSGTFGPLTVIAFADDTEDDAFGGPYGDPRFTLTLPSTGTYSLLVATLFNPGDYEIVSTGTFDSTPAPVPEPGTWMLMGTGLVGLIGYGIRKRRTAA